MKKAFLASFITAVFLLASCTGGELPPSSSQPVQTGAGPTSSRPTKTIRVKPTPTKDIPARATRYYVADRVISDSDYATLASWGVNTAIVQFEVNWKTDKWMQILQAAADAGVNIVIWPSDWKNKRANCDAGFAYPLSVNGDIIKVKPLLDVAVSFPNFIGIVTAHEWMWGSCPMTFDEMAGLKTQLRDALAGLSRPDVKIWNYTNSLASDYASYALPDDQVARIMDVAVIWKHCAGDAEGTCDNSLRTILDSRNRLITLDLDDQVDLVYLIQTFTSGGGYSGKFSLSQLEEFGCQFLRTSILDGFGFYTWDAGWWDDLHAWPDLQLAIPYIHENCTNPPQN